MNSVGLLLRLDKIEGPTTINNSNTLINCGCHVKPLPWLRGGSLGPRW